MAKKKQDETEPKPIAKSEVESPQHSLEISVDTNEEGTDPQADAAPAPDDGSPAEAEQAPDDGSPAEAVPAPEEVPDPDAPPNVKGRLGALVVAQGANRKLLVGRVLEDHGDKLQLDLMRGPDAVRVKYMVKESDLLLLHDEADHVPRAVERQGQRIIVRPHISGQSGEVMPVLAGRLLNKPGKQDVEAAGKMFDGDTLHLVFENRHPAVTLDIKLHGVVDKQSVVEWMARETSLTCNGPTVIAEIEDPSVRIFTDPNWEPFQIAFSGPWSCEERGANRGR